MRGLWFLRRWRSIL